MNGKKWRKYKRTFRKESSEARSQAPSLTSCSSSGFLGGRSRRLGGKGLTPAGSRGVPPTPLTIGPGSSKWGSGEKGKTVSIGFALFLTLACSLYPTTSQSFHPCSKQTPSTSIPPSQTSPFGT